MRHKNAKDTVAEEAPPAASSAPTKDAQLWLLPSYGRSWEALAGLLPSYGRSGEALAGLLPSFGRSREALAGLL